MSSKFFALIHGGEIRLAPNVKVVPADTFSTLSNSCHSSATVRSVGVQGARFSRLFVEAPPSASSARHWMSKSS